MMDADRSVTLTHELDWELRLVFLGMGLFALVFPFLQDNWQTLPGLHKVLWILGGLAGVAFALFGKSTMITAHGGEVTVRERGLFGSRKQVLPASSVQNVEVGYLPRGKARHYVAVRLKGRRQTFMGGNHATRDEAEAERDAVLAALGQRMDVQETVG
jgi:hypothetical protein